MKYILTGYTPDWFVELMEEIPKGTQRPRKSKKHYDSVLSKRIQRRKNKKHYEDNLVDEEDE
jgi:hypothetical protein